MIGCGRTVDGFLSFLHEVAIADTLFLTKIDPMKYNITAIIKNLTNCFISKYLYTLCQYFKGPLASYCKISHDLKL